MSLKDKKKLSRLMTGKYLGEKNPNWKGGISLKGTPPVRQRWSIAHREWRKKVLKRDGYKCIICGRTENLEVDHIKSFKNFPKERFWTKNGRTLCKIHHRHRHVCERLNKKWPIKNFEYEYLLFKTP